MLVTFQNIFYFSCTDGWYPIGLHVSGGDEDPRLWISCKELFMVALSKPIFGPDFHHPSLNNGSNIINVNSMHIIIKYRKRPVCLRGNRLDSRVWLNNFDSINLFCPPSIGVKAITLKVQISVAIDKLYRFSDRLNLILFFDFPVFVVWLFAKAITWISRVTDRRSPYYFTVRSENIWNRLVHITDIMDIRMR